MSFGAPGNLSRLFKPGMPALCELAAHFLSILVREGDALKVKVDSANFTGPPVPAETK